MNDLLPTTIWPMPNIYKTLQGRRTSMAVETEEMVEMSAPIGYENIAAIA